MCISTEYDAGGDIEKWDGEEKVGRTPGLEEAPSATCRRGKDRVGSTAEAHAGTGTDPIDRYPR